MVCEVAVDGLRLSDRVLLRVKKTLFLTKRNPVGFLGGFSGFGGFIGFFGTSRKK